MIGNILVILLVGGVASVSSAHIVKTTGRTSRAPEVVLVVTAISVIACIYAHDTTWMTTGDNARVLATWACMAACTAALLQSSQTDTLSSAVRMMSESDTGRGKDATKMLPEFVSSTIGFTTHADVTTIRNMTSMLMFTVMTFAFGCCSQLTLASASAMTSVVTAAYAMGRMLKDQPVLTIITNTICDMLESDPTDTEEDDDTKR